MCGFPRIFSFGDLSLSLNCRYYIGVLIVGIKVGLY